MVPADLKESLANMVGKSGQAERNAKPRDHPQILIGKKLEPDKEEYQKLKYLQ